MNSLTKLIASTSALIASLSFAWIALTLTGTIPRQHVTVHHDGGFELSSGLSWEKAFRIDLDHSGSVDMNHSGSMDHSGSVEITR